MNEEKSNEEAASVEVDDAEVNGVIDNEDDNEVDDVENIQQDIQEIIAECIDNIILHDCSQSDDHNNMGCEIVDSVEGKNAQEKIEDLIVATKSIESPDDDELSREIEQFFQMGLNSAERKRGVGESYYLSKYNSQSITDKSTGGNVLDVPIGQNSEPEYLAENEDFLSLYFNLGKLYAGASSEVSMYA